MIWVDIAKNVKEEILRINLSDSKAKMIPLNQVVIIHNVYSCHILKMDTQN
jgi:hypothetical protein